MQGKEEGITISHCLLPVAHNSQVGWKQSRLEEVSSVAWVWLPVLAPAFIAVWLYLFPATAVTNYRRLSGLKNTNLPYSSGSQKSKMSHWAEVNPAYQHSMLLLGTPGPFLGLFQLSEVTHSPWLQPPLPSSKPEMVSSPFHTSLWSRHFFCLPILLLRILLITVGPPRINSLSQGLLITT
jgi:hypothetical protein